MLTFPYQSRAQRLRAFVRSADTIRLFVNDIDPSALTKPEEFVEPTKESGYAPIQLASPWNIESVGTAVRAYSAEVQWTFKGQEMDVHGHYALDSDGQLLWSERFDGPFEVRRPGDALQLKFIVDSHDLHEEVDDVTSEVEDTES